MMRSLDQRLPAAPALLLLSGIASVVLLGLLARLPAPLNDGVAHLGLQLAVSAESLQQRAHSFAQTGAALGQFFRYDTLFPLAYALCLGLLCGMLARIHADSGRRALASGGVLLSHAVLLCAPLDWLENRWLAQVIDQAPGMAEWYVSVGRNLSAGPKTFLLCVTVVWLLYALFSLWRGHGRSTPG